MKNEIKIQSQSKAIVDNDRLYLLNLDNGRVFLWTAYLSVKQNMIDCTVDGQPINPSDVPGNHPWIKMAVNHLHDNLGQAGLKQEYMEQVGQDLTEAARKKYRTLGYEKSKQMQLEDMRAPVGPMVRIINNIDKRAAAAHREIDSMAANAMRNINKSVLSSRADIWLRYGR